MFGQNQISVGRKKGATNKASRAVKKAIAEIVNDNMQQVRLDIQSLEPRDRVQAIIALSKMVIPSLKAVEMEIDYEAKAEYLDKLEMITDAEFKAIREKLEKEY